MDQLNQQTPTPKPSRIKRAAKFLFDVPTWVGTENIQGYAQWIGRSFAAILSAFRKPTDPINETFEEAVQRQALTEADLARQLHVYTINAWIFLGLAVASCVYMAFLWSRTSWVINGAIFFVMITLFVKSYFYSFWCLQMYKKKLGCTFGEWLTWIFKGKL